MSSSWERELVELLNRHRSIAILGIGNPYRMDDRIGCYIADLLEGGEGLEVFSAGTTPENFIDPIVNSDASLLLVIDAADFGGEPGEVRFVSEEELSLFTLSTHAIPLPVVVSMIRLDRPDIEVRFLGIQVAKMDFGEEMSAEVVSAGERIAEVIKGARRGQDARDEVR